MWYLGWVRPWVSVCASGRMESERKVNDEGEDNLMGVGGLCMKAWVRLIMNVKDVEGSREFLDKKQVNRSKTVDIQTRVYCFCICSTGNYHTAGFSRLSTTSRGFCPSSIMLQGLEVTKKFWRGRLNRRKEEDVRNQREFLHCGQRKWQRERSPASQQQKQRRDNIHIQYEYTYIPCTFVSGVWGGQLTHILFVHLFHCPILRHAWIGRLHLPS